MCTVTMTIVHKGEKQEMVVFIPSVVSPDKGSAPSWQYPGKGVGVRGKGRGKGAKLNITPPEHPVQICQTWWKADLVSSTCSNCAKLQHSQQTSKLFLQVRREDTLPDSTRTMNLSFSTATLSTGFKTLSWCYQCIRDKSSLSGSRGKTHVWTALRQLGLFF